MLWFNTVSLIALIVLVPIIRGDDGGFFKINEHDERDMQELINHLVAAMNERDQPSFDVSKEDDLLAFRRIIADHGFDPGTLMGDSDFTSVVSTLSAATGLFKSGDARRWTTVNFAYQLACYQGIGGSMITQGLWAFLTYNGYGCYCGSGTYAGNYLDATDHCCKAHDGCYERVQKKYKLDVGCQTFAVPYTASCCKDEKVTKCTDSGPSASRELCECDQAMSSCAAKHKNSYNSAYYDARSRCQGGNKPRSAWDILKSCKDAFKTRVTFPVEYGSQGSCPAQKKKKGWWWGKKKDQ